MLEFWVKELGHYKLADLKAALIVEKRDKLSQGLTYRKTLRSPATCNRYLSGLSVILQCCVGMGLARAELCKESKKAS